MPHWNGLSKSKGARIYATACMDRPEALHCHIPFMRPHTGPYMPVKATVLPILILEISYGRTKSDEQKKFTLATQ